MKWPRWFGRSNDGVSEAAAAWRREWTDAIAAPGAPALDRLRNALAQLSAAGTADNGPGATDLETEEEMLDALARLVELNDPLDRGDLPQIETTHRVVGTDVCHFTGPASMPDTTAQPSGRLLLTGTRAVFVGGPRLVALPWHAASDVGRTERDVLIVKHDRDDLLRFRCNTYADAVIAAAIARRLMDARRRTL